MLELCGFYRPHIFRKAIRILSDSQFWSPRQKTRYDRLGGGTSFVHCCRIELRRESWNLDCWSG